MMKHPFSWGRQTVNKEVACMVCQEEDKERAGKFQGYISCYSFK